MKQSAKRFLSTVFGIIFVVGSFVIYFNSIRPAYKDIQDKKVVVLSKENLLGLKSALEAAISKDKAGTEEAVKEEKAENIEEKKPIEKKPESHAKEIPESDLKKILGIE